MFKTCLFLSSQYYAQVTRNGFLYAKRQKTHRVLLACLLPCSLARWSSVGWCSCACSSDLAGVVKLWDLRKLADFHTIEPTSVGAVSALRFDSSGSYLAVGGNDTRVFRTKPWDVVKTFSDHSAAVTGVAFGAGAK